MTMKLLKMYINKGTKLNKTDRFVIVQRWNNGWSAIKIAKRFNVSPRTVYNVLARFRLEGVFGLQDRKPGVLRTPLNPVFYANIVSLRKKTGWGACRIEKHFKKKGFSVSHNKINQVIQYEKLTRRKMGKQKKPKYVRYEAEKPNDQ